MIRYLGTLAVLVAAIYAVLLEYATLGPEFCWFYLRNAGLGIGDVAASYAGELGLRWYRPTPFITLPWLVSRVISWHNLVGWQAVYVTSLFATCCALYWFLLILFPGRRVAALLACAFVASHPVVMPAVLLLSGFDFIHLAAILLSVGLFLTGRTVASLAMFAVALTSKEVAIAVPFYLIGASIVLARWPVGRTPSSAAGPPAGLFRNIPLEPTRGSACGPGGPPHETRWPHLAVLPHFALAGLYWFLHLRIYPSPGPEVVYRDTFNLAMILQNLRKFPLWMAHIFGHTGDTFYHGYPHDRLLNNVFGWATLLLVIAVWAYRLRTDRATRPAFAILTLWYLVFLAIPVYAGAWFWHANLPLLAYAALLGIALDTVIARIRWRPAGWAVVAALLVYFCISGRIAIRDVYERGVYRHAFALNRNVIGHPPVDPARLGRAPLIYLEDRWALGDWSYGAGGNLFRFVYQRPHSRERVVPHLDTITGRQKAEWLAQGPDAFFFRYDDQGHWYDATAEFRNLVTTRSPAADP